MAAQTRRHIFTLISIAGVVIVGVITAIIIYQLIRILS